MSEMHYDYGRCQVCGEHMIEQEIKQDFWIKGNLIVIEGIPAGVCPQCGEKVVRAEIGQRVANLIADSNKVLEARTINVPVISFTEKAA